MYFFDTYAFWEILKRNPKYEQFSKHAAACTIFNAHEFYVTLRREFNEEIAIKHVEPLQDCIIETTIQNVMDAVEMKKRLNKQNVSFIDCLGYVKAKELGIKFLTGDRQFEKMGNVEFVK